MELKVHGLVCNIFKMTQAKHNNNPPILNTILILYLIEKSWIQKLFSIKFEILPKIWSEPFSNSVGMDKTKGSCPKKVDKFLPLSLSIMLKEKRFTIVRR